MQAADRLIVYVGYSHAKKIPEGDAPQTEWMAARLKALTGIDPLTVAQTVCRHQGDEAFLATAPAGMPSGLFDMIVSHPVERFEGARPRWRREAGDIPRRDPCFMKGRGMKVS